MGPHFNILSKRQHLWDCSTPSVLDCNDRLYCSTPAQKMLSGHSLLIQNLECSQLRHNTMCCLKCLGYLICWIQKNIFPLVRALQTKGGHFLICIRPFKKKSRNILHTNKGSVLHFWKKNSDSVAVKISNRIWENLISWVFFTFPASPGFYFYFVKWRRLDKMLTNVINWGTDQSYSVDGRTGNRHLCIYLGTHFNSSSVGGWWNKCETCNLSHSIRLILQMDG